MMSVESVSIAVGLVVSLMFSELLGLAAGGMIVPGYLALCWDQPLCIVITLLASLLTFGVVRLISQVAILYGRRRIVITIIVGFWVGALLRMIPAWAAAQGLFGETAASDWFSVVGFIIPGLIAIWLDRQGMLQTLAPLLTSSVIVRLVLIILGLEMMS